jgi:hypothetical protein
VKADFDAGLLENSFRVKLTANASHVSSTGQLFPADSRSFAANFARIRKGIASSYPGVKITYSNTQPFFRDQRHRLMCSGAWE